LVDRYNKIGDELIRDVMRLSVYSDVPYENVMNMTNRERRILGEVLRERAEKQNPNKVSQKMVAGEMNGPQGPQSPRQEFR